MSIQSEDSASQIRYRTTQSRIADESVRMLTVTASGVERLLKAFNGRIRWPRQCIHQPRRVDYGELNRRVSWNRGTHGFEIS